MNFLNKLGLFVLLLLVGAVGSAIFLTEPRSEVVAHDARAGSCDNTTSANWQEVERGILHITFGPREIVSEGHKADNPKQWVIFSEHSQRLSLWVPTHDARQIRFVEVAGYHGPRLSFYGNLEYGRDSRPLSDETISPGEDGCVPIPFGAEAVRVSTPNGQTWIARIEVSK